jgi:hypothetical protein
MGMGRLITFLYWNEVRTGRVIAVFYRHDMGTGLVIAFLYSEEVRTVRVMAVLYK